MKMNVIDALFISGFVVFLIFITVFFLLPVFHELIPYAWEWVKWIIVGFLNIFYRYVKIRLKRYKKYLSEFIFEYKKEINMKMQKEIEHEYNNFLSEINLPGFKCARYMWEVDYDHKYSRKEINEAKEILEEKIRKYLHDNMPGKYIVTSGINITVKTLVHAWELNMPDQEIRMFLVK